MENNSTDWGKKRKRGWPKVQFAIHSGCKWSLSKDRAWFRWSPWCTDHRTDGSGSGLGLSFISIRAVVVSSEASGHLLLHLRQSVDWWTHELVMAIKKYPFQDALFTGSFYHNAVYTDGWCVCVCVWGWCRWSLCDGDRPLFDLARVFAAGDWVSSE